MMIFFLPPAFASPNRRDKPAVSAKNEFCVRRPGAFPAMPTASPSSPQIPPRPLELSLSTLHHDLGARQDAARERVVAAQAALAVVDAERHEALAALDTAESSLARTNQLVHCAQEAHAATSKFVALASPVTTAAQAAASASAAAAMAVQSAAAALDRFLGEAGSLQAIQASADSSNAIATAATSLATPSRRLGLAVESLTVLALTATVKAAQVAPADNPLFAAVGQRVDECLAGITAARTAAAAELDRFQTQIASAATNARPAVEVARSELAALTSTLALLPPIPSAPPSTMAAAKLIAGLQTARDAADQACVAAGTRSEALGARAVAQHARFAAAAVVRDQSAALRIAGRDWAESLAPAAEPLAAAEHQATATVADTTSLVNQSLSLIADFAAVGNALDGIAAQIDRAVSKNQLVSPALKPAIVATHSTFIDAQTAFAASLRASADALVAASQSAALAKDFAAALAAARACFEPIATTKPPIATTSPRLLTLLEELSNHARQEASSCEAAFQHANADAAAARQALARATAAQQSAHAALAAATAAAVRA